jgi:hypothetical protein
MGLAKDFFRAVKEDGPLIIGMLKAHAHGRTMGAKDWAAYEAIVATQKFDGVKGEIFYTVPAGLEAKHVDKALRQIELENDPAIKMSVRRDGPKKPPSGKPSI